MNERLDEIIRKVLTDQPICFTAKGKSYALYPTTMGKLYLTAPLVEQLQIDTILLGLNPFLEALRIVKTKREECTTLIAYHTLQTKDELLNCNTVKSRAEEIAADFDDEDIATTLITIFRDSYVDTISKGTQLDKETNNLRRANAAKDSHNTLIFGGKTIWGSLIDVACERYKWTFDYVLWGISYANLTLMLKDKVTSVYLTDKERKNVRLSDYSSEKASGDDRETVMKLVKESLAHPS